jgi:hypothetical protein
MSQYLSFVRILQKLSQNETSVILRFFSEIAKVVDSWTHASFWRLTRLKF